MKKRIKLWVFAGICVFAAAGWFTLGYRVINLAAAENDASKESPKPVAVRVTPSGKDSLNRLSVRVTPCRKMTFEARIETFGNVETKNYALVSARIPGVIDKIYVAEGDRVVAGESKLFQIEKIKLSQSVEIARQAVAVALSGLRARKATIARIEADFEKARTDYERFKRLYENDQAVTKNAFESQESRYRQLKAALEEARAGADLALRQKEQAQSQLIIATKDLKDSLVRAPISGHISIRFREPGEMVNAGTPVFRIDDLSVLEVSAFLPYPHYSQVLKDQTKLRVTAGGVAVGELPVTYKSPTIDSKLRNFEVKALLENPPQGVAPGALAKVEVLLEAHEALGVPRNAVFRRTEGDFIFLADGGKARMVQVKTGSETDGWVEVTGDGIQVGRPVITMGQDQLDNNKPITVLKEERR